MTQTRLETLQSLEVFSSLGSNELAGLAAVAVERSFGSGDVLFLEGQPCEGVWVLVDGAAKIVKTTVQGRQVVLATQAGPSTVAEVPVFDGGPYPASLIAVRPTALLLLKRDFLAACRTNPELALHFLRIFGRRLRQLVALVEQITFGSIRQRLAADLLSRAGAAGSSTFQLEETQEQFAARLGTVREVISRNLSRFQSQGLLRVERKVVEIVDQEGLRNEAETEL